MYNYLRKLLAFTLAEVLITLAIIGVVAALTIPNLTAKYQVKQRVTATKKAYSVLSNAYNLAIYNNGGSNDFGFVPRVAMQNDNEENYAIAAANGDKFFNIMKPYLKIAKECEHGEEGCFPSNATYRDGTPCDLVSFQNGRRKFALLQDGMSIGFLADSYTGLTGVIYVDVNGFKSPNVVGTDIFQFNTNVGVNQLGMSEEMTGNLDCYTNGGWSCGAWVLAFENQDYLKCDDLSWDGKHKCD